jgi:hypothetical protein
MVTQENLGLIWSLRQTKKLIEPIREKVITSIKKGEKIEGGQFAVELKTRDPYPDFSYADLRSLMSEADVMKLSEMVQKKCSDWLMIELRESNRAHQVRIIVAPTTAENAHLQQSEKDGPDVDVMQ